jgi:hypothetical protein
MADRKITSPQFGQILAIHALSTGMIFARFFALIFYPSTISDLRKSFSQFALSSGGAVER